MLKLPPDLTPHPKTPGTLSPWSSGVGGDPALQDPGDSLLDSEQQGRWGAEPRLSRGFSSLCVARSTPDNEGLGPDTHRDDERADSHGQGTWSRKVASPPAQRVMQAIFLGANFLFFLDKSSSLLPAGTSACPPPACPGHPRAVLTKGQKPLGKRAAAGAEPSSLGPRVHPLSSASRINRKSSLKQNKTNVQEKETPRGASAGPGPKGRPRGVCLAHTSPRTQQASPSVALPLLEASSSGQLPGMSASGRLRG